jgi:hypothetical protein
MIFRRDSLVDPSRPKAFKDLTAADMARMEQEMSLVQSRFKAIELSYGTDVLNLVLTRGYVSKLLNNAGGDQVSGAASAGVPGGVPRHRRRDGHCTMRTWRPGPDRRRG